MRARYRASCLRELHYVGWDEARYRAAPYGVTTMIRARYRASPYGVASGSLPSSSLWSRNAPVVARCRAVTFVGLPLVGAPPLAHCRPEVQQQMGKHGPL